MKHDNFENLGMAVSFLCNTRRRLLSMKLREFHSTGPASPLLLGIREFPGKSQDFHALRLGVDKATVARGADTMENAGLIVRKITPNNRRQYQIFLTEAGEEACQKMEKAYNAWVSMLAANLTEEEQKEAVRLLNLMADGLEEVE